MFQIALNSSDELADISWSASGTCQFDHEIVDEIMKINGTMLFWVVEFQSLHQLIVCTANLSLPFRLVTFGTPEQLSPICPILF